MTRTTYDTSPESTADVGEFVGEEWSVYYIRTAWQYGQRRIFQSRPPAERFIAKLRARGRRDLSPLEYVVLQRREVTDWSNVR